MVPLGKHSVSGEKKLQAIEKSLMGTLDSGSFRITSILVLMEVGVIA